MESGDWADVRRIYVGETLARDVKVVFDPQLVTTLDDENMTIGGRDDLLRHDTVTVTASGRRGPEARLVQVLDLDVFYGYQKLEQYGTHHIAKTLRAWTRRRG